MRFALYIPQDYQEDFNTFNVMNNSNTSRVICSMIRKFNDINIRLNIPTIRKILLKNPEQIKCLKELLDEFNR